MPLDLPAARRVLSIRAGRTARQRISERGLDPTLFSTLLGASGGPKWLMLYGIDKLLAERWLPKVAPGFVLLGSSIGSWRHACLAQAQPSAAVERFREQYVAQRYSARPSAAEVSRVAAEILDAVLADHGARELVHNQQLSTHMIAARCRGLLASERQLVQALGLGLAASCNAVSRASLRWFFERALLHTGAAPVVQLQTTHTQSIALTEQNLRPALMASGAIPLVLAGVTDLPGARAGTYRDGGVVDYHFDFQMTRPAGLCLFPHFSSSITPGWFDKGLSSRRVSGHVLDEVVMLSPAPELVAALPHGKISDRDDFKNLTFEERTAAWQQVVAASERMAEVFSQVLDDREPARFLEAL